MIAPMEFEDDFIDFLERKAAGEFKLKGFDGENNKEIYKRPKVVKGFLLPKMNDNSQVSELPYICFRIIKLETIKVGKTVIALKRVYCLGVIVQVFKANTGNKLSLMTEAAIVIYGILWSVQGRRCLTEHITLK